MNFRMVNETASIDEAMSGRVPPGSDLLFELDPNTGEKTGNDTAETLFDARMSGIYIITGIRHGISTADSNHKMRLTCVRDSVGRD